jgi:hypothetical protein
VKSALLTTTGLLLSTAALATGCGGGGSDTMRATLTDDGCTYEGDTTPAPGLHTIEVENKTTHFATFAMWKLVPGVSAEDVQHAYTQALADFKRTHEIPRVGRLQAYAPFAPSVGALYAPFYGLGTNTDPEATSELPLNEYSGRFVIVCFEGFSADTRTSPSALPSPRAVYVATELDVR